VWTRGLRSKPDISVKLRSDVEGLGKAGDVVVVSPGYMRNYLFRVGLAKYIPRIRRQMRYSDKVALEERRAKAAAAAAAVETEPTTVASTPKHPLQERLDALKALPPLRFVRRVRELPADAPANAPRPIFGSVAIDDILLRLRETHQLVVERTWASLESEHDTDRLRHLGKAHLHVQIPDIGEAKIIVEVVPDTPTSS
jgi:ribosomal protein L9